MTAPEDDGRHLREIAAEHPDDEQLTLWALYSLSERGLLGVPDELEWSLPLLEVRGRLETAFEERLRQRWHEAAVEDDSDSGIADRIFGYVESLDGPSIAAHVHREATVEQVLQLLRWRSLYHLREADPTTWVIPRLDVATKAAVVELQYDEYGAGDPARLHSNLFALGMDACGLDPSPGAYVDEAPAELLELNNAMSLFGLHRRLRGAALGHLAAFESTSSLPSRRMAQGLERLGFPPEIVHYYEEHIEADAVHEQLAARDICGGLLEDAPELTEDVMFGVFSCTDLEARFAQRALTEWEVS